MNLVLEELIEFYQMFYVFFLPVGDGFQGSYFGFIGLSEGFTEFECVRSICSKFDWYL